VRKRAEAELEELYRRYRGDVYRYALRASRDENEAEEVTQAAFVNAYRALARGGVPRRPRAWLITIAENVRRRRLRRPREEQLPETYEAPAPEPEVTPGDLVAAFGTLPEAQRRALLLRELGGRSYGEIARELGTSVGAVQMLLFRARRDLREWLKRVAGMPAVSFESWFTPGAPALRAGLAAAGAIALAVSAGGGGGTRVEPPRAHDASGLLPPTAILLSGPAARQGGAPPPTVAARADVPAAARPAAPRTIRRLAGAQEDPAGAPVDSPAVAPPPRVDVPGTAAPAPSASSPPLPPAAAVPALPAPPAAEQLPQLPELPVLPELPPVEVPAPPAPPLVPEAPALPELGGRAAATALAS
jgi:RNA polymerase sigma-70 factor (ECF subfamily)